ncbi:hypothetical protein COX93_02750 [Candidatus Nomurabacteria bacterium CG_4_10_14_0_2_um_filter_30_12]|uniref:Protein containing YHS domain protein n=3 Tax=Candidatus Nomuraibacteriota TaxID=1752729 RepID=A0A1J4UYU4_9BACT|nr:MAG: hypothetical protein AUJ22_00240 [Candidatus Nomurabacteria bacterium CG1_02_31_12]PIR68653.1 MAG: hypothetical protein COU48_02865 [Candidatus Nomurabacteria bacterium CG10_big_fil_rev_8_21_14_0_10_03_31_7]PIZ86949.1 MAG: hypothetical protein COX93_02750 [Candidatus Nomurabacteria bacterium CG_4_10_14_0_2_um_filter_30_12]
MEVNLSNPYNKHGHSQIKICVSGAADTSFSGPGTLDKAKELGQEIARQGAIIVTGATTGFPFWAAMGAKEENGISIGFSPAASEKEHVEVYKLPLDYMDLIIYTGFGYPGRDLILTRSSDAVVFGCGRIGTIHEFTVAFEDDKPIGILRGPWEMSGELEDIIAKGHRPNDKVIFGDDPKKLIENLIILTKKYKINENK